MITLTTRQHWAWHNNECFMGTFLEFSHIPARIINGVVEFDTQTVTERIWSHAGSVADEDGNIWYGYGNLMDFSGLSWKENTYVEDVSFTFNAVDEQTTIRAEASQVRGHIGKLLYAMIDSNRRIIDNMIPVREFTLDSVKGNRNEDGTYSLTYWGYSGMHDLTGATNLLWSAAEQRQKIRREGITNPDGTRLVDLGFEEISLLDTGIDIAWHPGRYEGRGTRRVQHLTSISGTRLPVNDEDYFIPRREF